MKLIEFFKGNYEWVFSGIGVFVLSVIFSIVRSKNKNANSTDEQIKSTDIEMGREILKWLGKTKK